MWRSQPPTAQPRTQFKSVGTQLLWLDWQLRWPVTRRLGPSWQYNWDIRPKPMSTHWGRMRHICVSKPSHYWTLDNGLAPIQCQAMIWSDIHCLINFTLGNKRCNFNRNSNFFIQENAFQNIICKMAYILHLHQYVQSNLAKFRLSRTPISVVESFSNFKWRKIRRWFSRTMCKISKWFYNWIIS